MNPLKMLSRGGAVSAPSDADFENVTLLLHGDGTNGAQNNTFLDSSTNNFTITRNGNATQGTFTPFSKPDGAWGNYFDGSGDWLQVASNSAFTWNGGERTFEAWVYPQSASAINPIFSRTNFSNSNAWELYINTDRTITFRYWTGADRRITTSGTVTLNSWNHIAFVYDGTSALAIYLNGVSSASGTITGTPINPSDPLNIGRTNAGSTSDSYFNGYITNARFVSSAIYTSTFTPSTAPLTNITNTSLLTCQSNRFKDNSSNNFAITANGDVKVTTFSPFPTLTAYDAATNGGSGYFDGSGDYLFAGATSIGSNNFTVEFWMYPTEVSGSYTYPAYTGSGGSRASGIYFEYNYLGTMTIGYNDAFLFYQNIGTIVAGAWNHIAVTRNGSTWKGFVNGVEGFSVTNAGTLDTFNQFIIGTGLLSGDFKGYVSSFREVVGTSLYNSAFTPPTAPLTAVANTELLCNFTNAGILDNSMSNNLGTVGNAQIDTTTKKYGTGSMEFDGTGDYLVSASSPTLALGSGDFTIESWVYVTAHTNADGCICLNWTGTWSANNWSLHTDHGSANEKFTFWVNNYNTGSPMLTSTTTVATGTWYHVAVTRSGSSWRLFVNGTQEGSTVTSSVAVDNGVSWPIYVSGALAGQVLNGFIDDLRITKGKARYTTTFTPPTAALPDIGE